MAHNKIIKRITSLRILHGLRILTYTEILSKFQKISPNHETQSDATSTQFV